MTTQEMLRTFIFNILDDDEGISEEAWHKLIDYLQATGEMELIGELSRLTKACNNRRYIV